MATSSTTASASAPRTRTGCWTCRDRGIKCDEYRPRCRKCARLSLVCQYGIRLQWIEDSKARGVCHGRQGVWSSSNRKKKQRQEYSSSRNWELQNSQAASSLQPASYDTAPYPKIFFLNTFVDDMDTYMTGTSDGDEYMDVTEHELADTQTIEQRKSRYANALCAAHSEPYVKANFGELLPHRSTLSASIFATVGVKRPLDALDGNILQYYDGVVARQAVILDDEGCNPFRYLILPMAFTSSTILSAIMVVSATKMSHIDCAYQAKALVHRQRLFSDLAKRLQTIKSDTGSFADALVSVVILCWADITDHCRPSWLNHMMGISSILDAGPIEACDDPSMAKLLRFCRQYLLYHLIMARATFRVDKLLPGWKPALTPLLEHFKSLSPPPSPVIMPIRITGCPMDWTPSPAPTPSNCLRRPQNVAEMDDPDEINAHQGFSNSLLLIINDICDLATKTRFDGMDADFQGMHRLHELLQKVNKLCRRIENIVQTPPRSLQRGSRPNAWGLLDPCIDDDEWRRLRQQEQLLGVVTATAEANRLGCLLFLDEICASRFPGIIPSCRSNRAKNIQNIIDLAEKICAYGSITAALPIWPVFMAACAVNGEQDRIRVSSLLDTYRSSQSFGTIPPTCAVIESVWRQRDLACGDKVPAQRTQSLRRTSVQTRGGIVDGKGRGVDKLQERLVDERYPWERAMLILKGLVLSLT